MGHSNLNETLRIMGKHPTGMRIQCQVYEIMSDNVLISCLNFAQERQEMMTQFMCWTDLTRYGLDIFTLGTRQ